MGSKIPWKMRGAKMRERERRKWNQDVKCSLDNRQKRKDKKKQNKEKIVAEVIAGNLPPIV